MKQHGLRLLVKRSFDVAAAGAILVAAAPVIAATALAVRATMGSPVLFRQLRPGRNGNPFMLLKFRSMNDSRNADGSLAPDEMRLTRVGRLLRSTSIDELPQLLCVLRGEMSIVGPRPLLMKYLRLYSQEQARRHDVLPGITGWAQINGRNAIDWDAKFSLDTWYVDNWSLWLDIRILGMTIVRVLQRHGVAKSGHATMPEFTGASTSPNLENSTRPE